MDSRFTIVDEITRQHRWFIPLERSLQHVYYLHQMKVTLISHFLDSVE